MTVFSFCLVSFFKMELTAPHRKFIRQDKVAIWTGTNDTDRKQEELIICLFNDLLIVAKKSSKSSTMKLREKYSLDEISLREPKLRKWAKQASGTVVLPVSPNKLEASPPLGNTVTGNPLSINSGKDSPTGSPIVNRSRDSSRESISSLLRNRRNSTKRDSYGPTSSGHYCNHTLIHFSLSQFLKKLSSFSTSKYY